MAKKFKGNRPLNIIKRDVLALGGNWNQEKFERVGSDYVTFELSDFHGAKYLPVLFNTFNGTFIIPKDRLKTTYALKSKGDFVTEQNTELDGVDWYDNLLNLIYEPLNETA